MKKRILLMLVVLAGALTVRAGEIHREILTVTSTSTNAATYVAVTNSGIVGYIHEIYLDVVTAGTTGQLQVVYSPELTTMADVTVVASTNLASDKAYRPRQDATDTSGAALTGDPPERFLLIGDDLIFSVTNASVTNVSFKAVVKWEEPKGR